MVNDARHNFKGPWSSLVGPLAMPAMVKHGRTFYVLKTNVCNVADHEPNRDSRVWSEQRPAEFAHTADAFFAAMPTFEKPRCEYCRSTIVNLLASHCDNCGAPTP